MITMITDLDEKIEGRFFHDHLRHISISAEPVRKLGCQFIINEQKCRKECVPFLFVCQDHKNIPDFQRRYHPVLYEHTLRQRIMLD